jgi:hypothetical protein
MRKHIPLPLSLIALALAFGALLLPLVTYAENVSQTAKAGAYTVTLKVLAAESFMGPHAEMMRDSGAQADPVNGPGRPNHHLVVFLTKDDKPVENADVSISFRKLSPKAGSWTKLPVVRMHVAGKGTDTTHYGNNLRMEPGSYEARVTVNGSAHARFRFTLD